MTQPAKHTPGPWVVHTFTISGKEKLEVLDATGINACVQANAHLIAAAPAMYEALKMARWLSNECECHESWNAPEGNLCGHCTADLAIKTALSQAEGKQ